MSRERIVTCCDIGSSSVKVGCALLESGRPPRLVGAGSSPSLGVRRGQIIDLSEVVSALKNSFAECERAAGVKISKTLVLVGGPRTEIMRTSGSIAVWRADGIVSDDDIARVGAESQAISLPQNKIIIHAEPIAYAVDNETGLKNPRDMKGVRLEVSALLALALSPILKSFKKAVGEADREVEDFVYTPLAVARSTLSDSHIEAGVALVNIGGGSTDISIFKERGLVEDVSVSLGGVHITHDVAIGLKTSLDVAERIKVGEGSAFASGVSKREQVVLAEWGLEHVNFSRYALAQIIEGRARELFESVLRELKRYTKDKALPAGVVLTGGGAELKGMVELAKYVLKLPVEIGRNREIESELAEAYEPAWSGVVGAILLAHFAERKSEINARRDLGPQGIFRLIKEWLEELLP